MGRSSRHAEFRSEAGAALTVRALTIGRASMKEADKLSASGVVQAWHGSTIAALDPFQTSLPRIVLASLFVIWFSLGLTSKVAIAVVLLGDWARSPAVRSPFILGMRLGPDGWFVMPRHRQGLPRIRHAVLQHAKLKPYKPRFRESGSANWRER